MEHTVHTEVVTDDAQHQSILCSILSNKKLHGVLVILNAKYINDLPNMIEDMVRIEIGST
jgi:hypothetical protein